MSQVVADSRFETCLVLRGFHRAFGAFAGGLGKVGLQQFVLGYGVDDRNQLILGYAMVNVGTVRNVMQNAQPPLLGVAHASMVELEQRKAPASPNRLDSQVAIR